jgi:hypothetical protein
MPSGKYPVCSIIHDSLTGWPANNCGIPGMEPNDPEPIAVTNPTAGKNNRRCGRPGNTHHSPPVGRTVGEDPTSGSRNSVIGSLEHSIRA